MASLCTRCAPTHTDPSTFVRITLRSTTRGVVACCWPTLRHGWVTQCNVSPPNKIASLRVSS
eukprot:10112623-Alexandrium_andersonii.AAC.1